MNYQLPGYQGHLPYHQLSIRQRFKRVVSAMACEEELNLVNQPTPRSVLCPPWKSRTPIPQHSCPLGFTCASVSPPAKQEQLGLAFQLFRQVVSTCEALEKTQPRKYFLAYFCNATICFSYNWEKTELYF